MKLTNFFDHHGILENPFAQEDASTDHVFAKHRDDGIRHPAWDKICGHLESPNTSVVFGEKGSGKTALRLQMIQQVQRLNRENAESRVFVIDYDDFNPFLDSFRERQSGRNRKPERAIRKFRLQDHIDAILSLGVTRLAERIVTGSTEQDAGRIVTSEDISALDATEKRDLMMLAAFYDQSHQLAPTARWNRLRSKVGYHAFSRWFTPLISLLITGLIAGLGYYFQSTGIFLNWWFILLLIAPWAPSLWKFFRQSMRCWSIARQVKVIDLSWNQVRKVLSKFKAADLVDQPMPHRNRSEDRYALLQKFQNILKKLRFSYILILVDRVDEPHLINGQASLMKDLLWPMFDNKLLKHPGLGFKLLLPADVAPYLQKQDREFYERSRLDKQNLILSLHWSGEALYDMVNDRLKACAANPEAVPGIRDLFHEEVTQQILIDTFGKLRVPRHLFKFMHRLLVEHCNRFTQEDPVWKVSHESLSTSLALYQRDLEAFDRGTGTL